MALPIFARLYQKANADNSLSHYTRKKFEPLNGRESRLLSCDFFKDDANFVEKLFGKNEAEVKEKKFGEKEKKKGFFKRLFGG
jgi:penicillin-binding protein 1A